MKKSLYVLFALLIVASMVLTACGGAAQPAEKIKVRWFVGLGTGTNAEQVAVQEEVVKDFNASQDRIELVLEIVPYDAARDTLSTQIASGNGPDIVGPVGWGGSNDFYGQWLDLAPYIEKAKFDTSIFDPALVKFYQVEGEQVGLPFAVFPGAIYFVPAMFDEAGLAYPPQKYGEKYELDGKMVDWNWDTVTEVAKRLTVDKNGNNAKSPNFDRTQIVQVGYSPQWQSILSVATFYDGAAKIYSGDKKGEYKSTLPDGWKQAWKWYYDGMYGPEPFIASGPLAGSPEFGGGNVFNSGKAAMGLTQTWYTCCLGEFKNAGYEFQLGIQPMGADGQVNGRIDADTFRIWKGTKNPEAAFEVLAYLITTGGDKLLPIYGAMPAIASKTEAFFAVKSADYPFVTKASWDVFVQGLAYPDTPSAEQYQPNSIEANARFSTFVDLLNNTPNLDFEAEYKKLVDDLNVIYNK
jgi:multiple sugar transport system substrate-binding protein